jgi:uncharacterized protein
MNKDHIQFPKEDIAYSAPTWNEMNQLAFDLTKQINQDGIKFDRVVTLAKGGWPLASTLVDLLQIGEVASIGVKFYSGLDERFDRPRIYQDIPTSIRGEKILLFDDVADTGKSLEFTIDYLKVRGAEVVKTATLFYKPHSEIVPDYYGEETSTWIVFPCDVVEMIGLLGNKWQKQGLKLSEIKTRLTKFSFNQEFIDYYTPKLLTT